MRKLLIVVALAFAMVLPLGAFANDIPDGADCANGAAPVTLGNEADRGAACVSHDGTVVVYVGGEAQSENNGNPAYGGACGAIIVNGTSLAGNPDWSNNGPDGQPGTADDVDCQ